MTLTYKEYLGVVAYLVVIGLLGVLWQKPLQTLGNTIQGQEYDLATTTSNQAGMANYRNLLNPAGIPAGLSTSTPGAIGSVNITAAGAPFCLYDATSTRTNAEWATTTIQCFSGVVGSWSLDRPVRKGVLIVQSTVDTVSSWASTSINLRR